MIKKNSINFIGVALLTCFFPYEPANANNVINSYDISTNIPPQEGQENLINFISTFPYDLYTIYSVENRNKFYVDDPQDSIKNVLVHGMVWEPYIDDLLQQYIIPGSCVVDAGAHIGTHSIVMSQAVGANGRVVSFEPQLKIYRELVMNARLNQCINIDCYRCALGDEQKTIEMNQIFPHYEGCTRIGNGGDSVEMYPLDNFNLQNVSLIKVDIEGSEDAFLDGATNTILQNRPVIIIEIQGGWDFDTAPVNIQENIIRTKNKLKALGYSVEKISAHDYFAVPI